MKRLLVLLPLVLMIGCFFLPDAVSGVTDAKSLNNLTMINAQRISFERSTNLSLPERLALAANANTESLSLKNGMIRNGDTAVEVAKAELIRLMEISPFEFQFDTSKVEECAAEFLIDSENWPVNIITWKISLTDTTGRRIDAVVDDETGMILQVLYRKTYNKMVEPALSPDIRKLSDDKLRDEAEAIAVMLADYYGLPVSVEDYKLSGTFAYYRADLVTEGMVLPLYGVVRETGFSINERV